jgi:hypothetical protein
MSSPQLRRADRSMSPERTLEVLARGYSGRLATVSEDGFPYCIPLLYLWIDGEVHLHTTGATGHLRANVERDPRVSKRVPVRPDTDRRRQAGQAEVLRSVDDEIWQAGNPAAQGLLPADRYHHRVCRCRRAHDRQGTGTAAAFRAVACARQHQDAKRFIAQGRSLAQRFHESCRLIPKF